MYWQNKSYKINILMWINMNSYKNWIEKNSGTGTIGIKQVVVPRKKNMHITYLLCKYINWIISTYHTIEH